MTDDLRIGIETTADTSGLDETQRSLDSLAKSTSEVGRALQSSAGQSTTASFDAVGKAADQLVAKYTAIGAAIRETERTAAASANPVKRALNEIGGAFSDALLGKMTETQRQAELAANAFERSWAKAGTKTVKEIDAIIQAYGRLLVQSGWEGGADGRLVNDAENLARLYGKEATRRAAKSVPKIDYGPGYDSTPEGQVLETNQMDVLTRLDAAMRQATETQDSFRESSENTVNSINKIDGASDQASASLTVLAVTSQQVGTNAAVLDVALQTTAQSMGAISQRSEGMRSALETVSRVGSAAFTGLVENSKLVLDSLSSTNEAIDRFGRMSAGITSTNSGVRALVGTLREASDSARDLQLRLQDTGSVKLAGGADRIANLTGNIATIVEAGFANAEVGASALRGMVESGKEIRATYEEVRTAGKSAKESIVETLPAVAEFTGNWGRASGVVGRAATAMSGAIAAVNPVAGAFALVMGQAAIGAETLYGWLAKGFDEIGRRGGPAADRNALFPEFSQGELDKLQAAKPELFAKWMANAPTEAADYVNGLQKAISDALARSGGLVTQEAMGKMNELSRYLNTDPGLLYTEFLKKIRSEIDLLGEASDKTKIRLAEAMNIVTAGGATLPYRNLVAPSAEASEAERKAYSEALDAAAASYAKREETLQRAGMRRSGEGFVLPDPIALRENVTQLEKLDAAYKNVLDRMMKAKPAVFDSSEATFKYAERLGQLRDRLSALAQAYPEGSQGRAYWDGQVQGINKMLKTIDVAKLNLQKNLGIDLGRALFDPNEFRKNLDAEIAYYERKTSSVARPYGGATRNQPQGLVEAGLGQTPNIATYLASEKARLVGLAGTIQEALDKGTAKIGDTVYDQFKKPIVITADWRVAIDEGLKAIDAQADIVRAALRRYPQVVFGDVATVGWDTYPGGVRMPPTTQTVGGGDTAMYGPITVAEARGIAERAQVRKEIQEQLALYKSINEVVAAGQQTQLAYRLSYKRLLKMALNDERERLKVSDALAVSQSRINRARAEAASIAKAEESGWNLLPTGAVVRGVVREQESANAMAVAGVTSDRSGQGHIGRQQDVLRREIDAYNAAVKDVKQPDFWSDAAQGKYRLFQKALRDMRADFLLLARADIISPEQFFNVANNIKAMDLMAKAVRESIARDMAAGLDSAQISANAKATAERIAREISASPLGAAIRAAINAGLADLPADTEKQTAVMVAIFKRAADAIRDALKTATAEGPAQPNYRGQSSYLPKEGKSSIPDYPEGKRAPTALAGAALGAVAGTLLGVGPIGGAIVGAGAGSIAASLQDVALRAMADFLTQVKDLFTRARDEIPKREPTSYQPPAGEPSIPRMRGAPYLPHPEATSINRPVVPPPVLPYVNPYGPGGGVSAASQYIDTRKPVPKPESAADKAPGMLDVLKGGVGNIIGGFANKVPGGAEAVKMVGQLATAFEAATGASLAAVAGIAAVGVAIVGIGLEAANAAAKLEPFVAQFAALEGSVTTAKERVADLQQQALKFSIFPQDQVFNAGKQLEIFTGSADKANSMMQTVANVAAVSGDSINSVALIFGRMYGALKEGQPLGRTAYQLQYMGLLSTEAVKRLDTLTDKVKSGALTQEEAWTAALAEFNKYKNGTALMSDTLQGKQARLGQEIEMVWQKLGRVTLPIVKGAFDAILAVVSGISAGVDILVSMLESAGDNIQGFVDMLLSVGDVGDAIEKANAARERRDYVQAEAATQRFALLGNDPNDTAALEKYIAAWKEAQNAPDMVYGSAGPQATGQRDTAQKRLKDLETEMMWERRAAEGRRQWGGEAIRDFDAEAVKMREHIQLLQTIATTATSAWSTYQQELDRVAKGGDTLATLAAQEARYVADAEKGGAIGEAAQSGINASRAAAVEVLKSLGANVDFINNEIVDRATGAVIELGSYVRKYYPDQWHEASLLASLSVVGNTKTMMDQVVEIITQGFATAKSAYEQFATSMAQSAEGGPIITAMNTTAAMGLRAQQALQASMEARATGVGGMPVLSSGLDATLKAQADRSIRLANEALFNGLREMGDVTAEGWQVINGVVMDSTGKVTIDVIDYWLKTMPKGMEEATALVAMAADHGTATMFENFISLTKSGLSAARSAWDDFAAYLRSEETGNPTLARDAADAAQRLADQRLKDAMADASDPQGQAKAIATFRTNAESVKDYLISIGVVAAQQWKVVTENGVAFVKDGNGQILDLYDEMFKYEGNAMAEAGAMWAFRLKQEFVAKLTAARSEVTAAMSNLTSVQQSAPTFAKRIEEDWVNGYIIATKAMESGIPEWEEAGRALRQASLDEIALLIPKMYDLGKAGIEAFTDGSFKEMSTGRVMSIDEVVDRVAGGAMGDVKQMLGKLGEDAVAAFFTGAATYDTRTAVDDMMKKVIENLKKPSIGWGKVLQTYKDDVAWLRKQLEIELNKGAGADMGKVYDIRTAIQFITQLIPVDQQQVLEGAEAEGEKTRARAQTAFEKGANKGGKGAGKSKVAVDPMATPVQAAFAETIKQAAGWGGDTTMAYAGGLQSESAITAVTNAAAAVRLPVSEALNNVAPAFTWGMNVGLAYASGLSSATVLTAIKNAVYGMGMSAQPGLKGESPPKEGPLKDIDKWGKAVGGSYVEGFAEGLQPLAGMVGMVLGSARSQLLPGGAYRATQERQNMAVMHSMLAELRLNNSLMARVASGSPTTQVAAASRLAWERSITSKVRA